MTAALVSGATSSFRRSAMTGSLTFWRSAFALAIHAAARFPRLVPTAVVEYVDRRFYNACLRESLSRAADEYNASVAERDIEAQRRSWAYGQVAMHDPTITRAQVDAVADTMPAPWSCLAGDLDGHDAGEIDERDLHDGEGWRVSRGQRNGWEA